MVTGFFFWYRLSMMSSVLSKCKTCFPSSFQVVPFDWFFSHYYLLYFTFYLLLHGLMRLLAVLLNWILFTSHSRRGSHCVFQNELLWNDILYRFLRLMRSRDSGDERIRLKDCESNAWLCDDLLTTPRCLEISPCL